MDYLDTVTIETTDDARLAVICSVHELTDISFLHFSDIENWEKQEIVCHDMSTGTEVLEKFFVYTQSIATGKFDYLIS